MVGENAIRLACRSSQAVTSCSASSRICRSVARQNSRLLVGGVPALVLHPSLVETHGGILPGRMSYSIVLVAGATGTFAHSGELSA